jgi:acyl carrier protein
MTLSGNMTLAELAKSTHAVMLAIQSRQFASLAQIQSWSEVGWRHRMFESLVVVQNYLVDESARKLGENVWIEDFHGPIHTNYPLLLLVEPGDSWRVSLIYDTSWISTSLAHRWLQDLTELLVKFPSSQEIPLGELLETFSPPPSAPVPRNRWVVQSQDYVPPQTGIEQRIAGVWEEVLHLKEVSTTQNVFELGAHSLLMVRLHQRMVAELKRDFPFLELFQFPTIRALAGHLERGDASGRRIAELTERAQNQRQALARLRERSLRQNRETNG